MIDAAVQVLAVNPVPWARSQMAFTLAFHIILVPLGVSWAFMTLIANYRAIKHDDADALLLAQRWSKYMAVTFAVGAVTGTVLSFEFGLLWPKFMGQWGEAFGVPFGFEGIFFFTEAIFVAIYIYGWRRMSPWAHFWTGVPIVIAGIFGAMSVVAANSWMNTPSGFTLDSSGKVTSVDPVAVIFNDAMPLESAHMLVAAYLVGGFMIASVYAAAMLKGRTDRYHRLGFVIAFTVAAIATPIQMGVGDALARWVYNDQPVKFAAIELVPQTSSDVPETLFGHLNSDGTVTGGIKIPGLASILSDPKTGKSTVVQGLNTVSADDRPTIQEVNTVHLAWDLMVGLGTLLFLLSLWYGATWAIRRRMPTNKVFLSLAASSGVLAVVTMEAGWVVTEVGRQPWIVYNLMKVEDAATANTGVWISFIVVTLLYLALGVTAILVLRGMSQTVPAGRRVRRGRGSLRAGGRRTGDRGGDPMSDLVAVVLLLGLAAYAVFGGADFGAGFWDLTAGSPERGARPRALIERSIGPVWEANHVWLIFVFVVTWTAFSRGLRLDHAHPLRPAHARRTRHRAARGQLRLPQVGRHPAQPSALRRGVRRLLGPGAVLPGHSRRWHRLRTGPRRRPGGRLGRQLAEPDLDRDRRPRGGGGRLPGGRLPRLGGPPRGRRRAGRSTSAAARSSPRSSSRSSARSGWWCCTATRRTSSTG